MERVSCPECEYEGSYKGYGCHFSHKHDGNPLVALVGEEKLRAMYAENSEKAVAEELGVSRNAVKGAIESLDDIGRRGQSEAESLKNEQRTAEERAEQTREAREEHFEKYGDGGHISVWTKENPKEHRMHSEKVASLGAPARNENGMAGVTGQDHPNWRGGKDIYDAVKKQLRPSFDSVKDEYRGAECQMCGATESEFGAELDVHHIVPLLAGGTNEAWNMMTLCRSCHDTAEWFTRDLLDPVLTV